MIKVKVGKKKPVVEKRRLNEEPITLGIGAAIGIGALVIAALGGLYAILKKALASIKISVENADKKVDEATKEIEKDTELAKKPIEAPKPERGATEKMPVPGGADTGKEVGDAAAELEPDTEVSTKEPDASTAKTEIEPMPAGAAAGGEDVDTEAGAEFAASEFRKTYNAMKKNFERDVERIKGADYTKAGTKRPSAVVAEQVQEMIRFLNVAVGNYAENEKIVALLKEAIEGYKKVFEEVSTLDLKYLMVNTKTEGSLVKADPTFQKLATEKKLDLEQLSQLVLQPKYIGKQTKAKFGGA